MNVLVSRPDRIGDVVLSTPVFRALRRARPGVRVSVFVREAVRPLLDGLDSIDDIIVFDAARHRGIAGARTLATEFRARRFDTFIALFGDATVAAAALLARIPVRIGPRSKPHSFVCYNRGVRQRRSRVEKHEAEYNLDLLRPLGIAVPPRTLFPEIAIGEGARRRAADWLRAHDIAGGAACVAIHPGMGGSALNWPAEHYFALARALVADGHRVVITAGPMDALVLQAARAALADTSDVACYHANDGIDVLAALYERMDLVIAPSTGPLHVAVAAGAPVLSFYPNVRVQSAARWGPYTAAAGTASVLVPHVDCAGDADCMRTISTDVALAEARRLLGLRHGP